MDEVQGFEEEVVEAGASGLEGFGLAAIELDDEGGVLGFPAMEGGAVDAKDGGGGGGGVADEEEGVTQVLDDARLECPEAAHDFFWLEYNTSAEARDGGVMRAWARNIVVLEDYTGDATTLMEPPVR